jgi:glycosyltransferase involved in cell wall biosynthesis
MRVTYFFRKPFTDHHHSIEELFGNIISSLPEKVKAENYIMPWISKGLTKRILNALASVFHQADINHITGDVHYVSYFLRKKKTILTIHDLAPLNRGGKLKIAVFKMFWFTLPAKRVRMITVISKFIKTELLQHIRISPEKIRVVYDCIPADLPYTPKPALEDKPVLFHIGTMPNKNLENVIRSIEDLDVRLIILGKLKPHHEELLRDSKTDYENYFNLPYESVLNLYKRCDIVLFASMYEGFGLPILEANAIGRPVITSRTSSMPEVAGDAALLVNPAEISEIKKAVMDLLENQALRAELVAKGLENVKRFLPKAIAAEYVNLYEEILKR